MLSIPYIQIDVGVGFNPLQSQPSTVATDTAYFPVVAVLEDPYALIIILRILVDVEAASVPFVGKDPEFVSVLVPRSFAAPLNSCTYK